MTEYREIFEAPNFFPNPEKIRECALAQEYFEPDSNNQQHWRGYRTGDLVGTIGGLDIDEHIYEKMKQQVPDLEPLDMLWVFHVLADPNWVSDGKNYSDTFMHSDASHFDWAGIVYLHPNPEPNSGTTFYSEPGKVVLNIENTYNTCAFYPSDILHSATNPFGKSIEDGRMTVTFFAKYKDGDKLGRHYMK
jgi:hypothetical protein